MWENLLFSIINGGFTGIVAYITKKDNAASRAEITMMKTMIAEDKKDIQDLKFGQKESRDEHLFKMSIKNAIIENANIKVNEFKKFYKNTPVASALNDYFEKIANFALMFFYSGLRNNDNISTQDFYNHLALPLNSTMYWLASTLNREIPIIKSIKHGNNIVELKFIEFFGTEKIEDRIENDCYARNTILLERLVKNGIKEPELKSIFVEYTCDFMTIITDKYGRFIELEDYEKAIERLEVKNDRFNM